MLLSSTSVIQERGQCSCKIVELEMNTLNENTRLLAVVVVVNESWKPFSLILSVSCLSVCG